MCPIVQTRFSSPATAEHGSTVREALRVTVVDVITRAVVAVVVRAD